MILLAENRGFDDNSIDSSCPLLLLPCPSTNNNDKITINSDKVDNISVSGDGIYLVITRQQTSNAIMSKQL
jgi:hypothetical protein